jgi:hypothetical protein
MEKTLREKLVVQIKKAFANAPFPTQPVIASDDYIQSEFKGKKWDEISHQVLGLSSSDLWHFSANPFRYYLQAYLIAFILHPRDVFMLPDAIVFFLMPSKHQEGSSKKYFDRYVKVLSPVERAAVHDFLAAYPDLAPGSVWAISEKKREQLQEAVDFWEKESRKRD